MPNRVLTKHAVVAMRSIAGGGFISDPKQARHLRVVAQQCPKLIVISPAPEDQTPRPYFVAALTPAGLAFIHHKGCGRHRKTEVDA
jgi:hypothetical protein